MAGRLAELGIVSRTRTYGDGTIGGEPFRTGALSHLLSNRIYIGEVKHHDQHYPGEHEPVLDKDLFNAVQSGLASRLNRQGTRSFDSGALLKGLLFDSRGNRMTPVHANKNGLRYRYYQSWVLNHGHKSKAGVISRVPAQELEDILLQTLKDRNNEFQLNKNEDTDTNSLLELVERIDILEGQIVITLKSNTDKVPETNGTKDTISVQWSKPSPLRKKDLIHSATETMPRRSMRSEVRSRLLKGIAQGRLWLSELVDNKDRTISDIATRHGFSERSIRSTISLGLLAPEIVEVAIDGHLPHGLTVTRLTDLPSNWIEQKQALGPV